MSLAIAIDIDRQCIRSTRERVEASMRSLVFINHQDGVLRVQLS